ncbi:hypothetical protein BH23ACT11_BH23ACT11_17120 [soil metagenome]
MQSAREEIRDLERVRYVTENYENLQGLTRVPIGLALLMVWAFFLTTGFEISSQPVANIFITVGLLTGGLLILLFFRIRKYYTRRYGQVRVIPRVFRRRRAAGGAVALTILVAGYFLTLWMGPLEQLEPLLLVLLGLGVMEMIDRWPERRLRPHYLVVGALVALSGLAMLFLVLSGMQYPDLLVLHLMTAFIGLILVIGGILDHLLLVRTMKSLPGDNGRAV